MQKQHNRGRATLVAKPPMEELLYHLLSDLRATGLEELDVEYLTSLPLPTLVDLAEEKVLAARCTAGAVQQYILWSQISAFVRKNNCGSKAEAGQRRLKAYESFVAGERACRRSNRRLAHYNRYKSRHSMCSLMEAAALKLQSVLPPVHSCYEDLLDHCTFGPGTTTASRSFNERSLFYKVSGHQTMTPGCRRMFMDYCVRNPRWINTHRDVQVETTTYDRVTFVPKSFKTERSITVQPSINLFLQKGIGWQLENVCERVRITLGDQTRNGWLAYQAATRGGYCTIDLSGASDSISVELIRWLFPADWFALLMAVRPSHHKDPMSGDVIPTAKFAGMGNSTTFPVESLVFWALLQACREACEDKSAWRVYGDDIIVGKPVVLLLCELLKFAGFSVNRDKSFFHGSFFESCGFDFLGGLKVTPLYIRAPLTSIASVYNLHNRLLQHAFFDFPRTLMFLRRLVLRPHLGPFSQPRKDLGFWHSSFNAELNSYFISEPPKGLWNPSLQRFEYTCTKLVQGYKKLKVKDETLILSLALLGERIDAAGFIADLGRPVLRTSSRKIGYWPTFKQVRDDLARQRRSGSQTWASAVAVAGLNRDVVKKVSDLLELDVKTVSCWL